MKSYHYSQITLPTTKFTVEVDSICQPFSFCLSQHFNHFSKIQFISWYFQEYILRNAHTIFRFIALNRCRRRSVNFYENYCNIRFVKIQLRYANDVLHDNNLYAVSVLPSLNFWGSIILWNHSIQCQFECAIDLFEYLDTRLADSEHHFVFTRWYPSVAMVRVATLFDVVHGRTDLCLIKNIKWCPG